MQHVTIMAALVLLPIFVHATERGYAGQEGRAIKAMSDQEIMDYRNGRGMGTSKAAELNHYPGPRHVLDHAQALSLSVEQQVRTQQIHDAMARDAARVGEKIVHKEAQLENLFATRQASPENTGRVVQEIAALQGEFRLVHLNAHLSMRHILSREQIEAYDSLRGYDGTKAHDSGHKHGMTDGNTGHK